MSDTEPALAGPLFNGRDARGLATDAEQSLRGIVHLAEASEHRMSATEIFGTLSAMTRMLEHVPEVTTRLRAAVEHVHAAHRLRINAGPHHADPDAAVRQLSDAVDAVLQSLGGVQLNMTRAQAALSDATFDDEA